MFERRVMPDWPDFAHNALPKVSEGGVLPARDQLASQGAREKGQGTTGGPPEPQAPRWVDMRTRHTD